MATTDTPEGTARPLSDAAGTWTLDPSATTITLQTKAMWGLAKVNGSFTALEGSGTVSATGAVTGTLSIDASSVDTGNKKRDNHLRSADFFEADKHAHFTYTATGASPAGADQVKVTGNLTVRDQTRPLDIVATVTNTGTSAVLTADFELDRSAWGVSWAKMGARLVNHVKVSAHFTKD
jgi:polyisoprenoid-binding protein YceI